MDSNDCTGGRFVAEFGGHTNIAAISVSIRAVLDRRKIPYSWPWYYPTPADYGARLSAHGFSVEFISLFPRPTPLSTGMAGWLETFAGAVLSGVPVSDRAAVNEEIIGLLEPSLCDHDGQWTADYVRLQVVARTP